MAPWKGVGGRERTLVKCAGYQWLRRPSSSAMLLERPRTRDGRMLGGTRSGAGGACCSATAEWLDAIDGALLRCRAGSSCTAACEPRCAGLAAEVLIGASCASATAASSVAAFILSSCACNANRQGVNPCCS